jgi:hypothetical protein
MGDTHVPSRAPAIPEWVCEEMRAADHVVHTGDFDSAEALATVRELAADLTAVAGNIDPATLDLPAVATLDAGGVRFVVTHGHRGTGGYDEHVAGVTAANAAAGPTVGVSGHTHQRRDAVVDGYRLVNPGSATGADPAPETSVVVVEAGDGEFTVDARVE